MTFDSLSLLEKFRSTTVLGDMTSVSHHQLMEECLSFIESCQEAPQFGSDYMTELNGVYTIDEAEFLCDYICDTLGL